LKKEVNASDLGLAAAVKERQVLDILQGKINLAISWRD
jgi:hypothetical protein